MQLMELHRHMEELDNRGRCHNIRLWGLPESVTNDQLEMALLHIFNDLLDRPLVTPIHMERFHRSLQARREAEASREKWLFA